MAFIRAFAGFWYDFVIGDDWKIAVAVLLVLMVGAVAVLSGVGGVALLPPLLGVLFGAGFTATMLIDTRKN
ncbi:hypothetical protein ACWEKM_31300 [Streptomyces sp. NPDC004752]